MDRTQRDRYLDKMNRKLDIRDTIKPDKRAEYRFGTCGDED